MNDFKLVDESIKLNSDIRRYTVLNMILTSLSIVLLVFCIDFNIGGNEKVGAFFGTIILATATLALYFTIQIIYCYRASNKLWGDHREK